MKLLPIILLATLTLGGCSLLPAPAPTPTIDPGPVTLSKADAAERYLQIVCPVNAASQAVTDAGIAREPEVAAGGAPDPTDINAAAVEAARVDGLAVDAIEDEYFEWPGDVGTQLGYIRDVLVGEMRALRAGVDAPLFEEAYFGHKQEMTSEQAAAGQEIRSQLELDFDPDASCVGYENALDGLTQEMLDRIEYLAQFEKSE